MEQTMQTQLAHARKNTTAEIAVGTNECRLARQGERLVARGVLADVVVTLQAPTAGFAAMLRFSAPEEANVSRARLEAVWEFADQALSSLLESVRSTGVTASETVVSAMGGADVAGRTYGRGKQMALAVQRSLWRNGVVLHGNDLGGSQGRVVWLETSSGRLIVRSTSGRLGNSAAKSQHLLAS
jgi:chemotaxis receptor (MCP) glutamine deamidase CheD